MSPLNICCVQSVSKSREKGLEGEVVGAVAVGGKARKGLEKRTKEELSCGCLLRECASWRELGTKRSRIRWNHNRFGGQLLGRKERGIQKRLARGWSLWRWMSAGLWEEEIWDDSQNFG